MLSRVPRMIWACSFRMKWVTARAGEVQLAGIGIEGHHSAVKPKHLRNFGLGIHPLVKRGTEFKQDVARHGTLELGVGSVDEHGTKQGHHGPGNSMSGAVDEGQGAPSAFFCEKQEITTENVTGPVNEQGFRKKLLKFFFSRQGHFKDGLGADDPLGDVDEVLADLVRQPLPLISLGLQLGVGLPNLEGALFHAFFEVVHMVPQVGLELDPMGNVEQGQRQRVFCGFRQAQFQTEVAGLAFLVPDKHVARDQEPPF